MTSLIQISTWQQDFIVDPFPLFQLIKKYLKPIFEDDNKLIVMHGATNDVKWLRRDFGSYIIGAIDTQELYNVYRDDGLNNLVGFKSLAEQFLPSIANFGVNKSLQLSDWTKRPLTKEMIQYARNDSHLLLRIFNNMRKEVPIKID
jgi:exosome complex exonuclease RRP6